MLHICCAPDGTTAIERLQENFKVIGYFGNSNIQPLEEYNRRKEAVVQLSDYYNIEIVYGNYNPEEWLENMKGLEELPEGGSRCRKCIFGNLFETAKKADELSIASFTTSLMTSPHKDVEWIKRCGEYIQKQTNAEYHHEIFRKKNGFLNSVQKSKIIGLYRQNYCGCLHSIYNLKNEIPRS
jgi:predicted adenine nucleotide alpha hydrolase (AANH) superfamily ATPase